MTLVSGCFALAAAACGPGGQPPKLDPLDDQVAYVGTELSITLRASDPQGGRVTFSYAAPDLKPAGGNVSISPYGSDGSQAVFRWTPVAADVGMHAVDFKAEGGAGTATETISIDVRQAVGSNQPPEFVAPLGPGAVLDLTASKCLDLEVTVKDSDAAKVTLAQADPKIDGATLTSSGPLAGSWHWCPSPAEIAGADVYTLKLTADDGVNPPTPKVYRILLKKPTATNCPGNPPIVLHTPSDATTQDNLVLGAQVTDDQGLKDPPTLYYGATATATAWTPLAMTRVSGDAKNGAYSATVPNPVAGMPAGASATLYYAIEAKDNDDATGDCDHTTRAPATGSFQMKVTSPGGEGNQPPCSACTADAQCGGAADNCVHVGDGDYCGKACSGDGDCPTNYTCAGPLTSVGGQSAKQCVPKTNSCSMIVPPTCSDDAQEPNDTIADATAKPPLDTGKIYSEKSCPAAGGGTNPDLYRIVLAEDSEITVRLAGGTTSDLDLQLLDGAGAPIAVSAGLGSTELVDHCLPAGTYFVQVYVSAGATPAENSYTLSYSGTNRPCPLEPNDTPDTATVVDLTTASSDDETGLSITATDDDWYRMELYQGDTVHVAVLFDQVNDRGDLDLAFYDGATDLTACGDPGEPDCTAANGKSVDSNEYYSVAIDHDGTYWLHVYGYAGSTNPYELCISVLEGVCPGGP